MFDPRFLQNTAVKWRGSSVILDLERLRMFFSPGLSYWGLLGHIQLCPSNACQRNDAHTEQSRWPEHCYALLRREEFDKRRKWLFLAVENSLLDCGAQVFPRPSQGCSHECLVWLHCGVLWRCEKWARWLSCPIWFFFFFLNLIKPHVVTIEKKIHYCSQNDSYLKENVY